MSHRLFEVVTFLESNGIWFQLHRQRDDSIMITATVVGARVEIDVFEDGHIEFSTFYGDEGVETDVELLISTLKERWEFAEGGASLSVQTT